MIDTQDQEAICLELMARGEDMLAYGAWEAPVKRLAMRGYCRKIGNGYRITDRGIAWAREQTGEDLRPPEMPAWIVTPVEGAGLAVLRRNDVAVSGYDAVTARYTPIVHGQSQGPDKTLVPADAMDGFLQAMLDAAWARGLRPSGGV